MWRVLHRQAIWFQKRHTSNLPAVRTKDGIATEATAIYANPLCMQMDQMILRAQNPEDVLMLLVTHRGVMFVHNLVTATSILAEMSGRLVPFSQSKKFKFPAGFEKSQRDKMLEDPRYILLVRDLMDYSDKLDLSSIESILSSLQKMDHCHYKLLGSLLKRIYSIDLSTDLSKAISIAGSLHWAGFGRANMFYDDLSILLIANMDSLNSIDYLNSLMTFSKVPKFYPTIYTEFASQLPHRIDAMTPLQMGIAAIAISEYGPQVDKIQIAVHSIASAMLNSKFSKLRDQVRVCISLRRAHVSHSEFLRATLNVAMNELVECDRLRVKLDPTVSSISDLSQLLDSCAYFGVRPVSENLIPFLEDNIDVITEESSIRFLSFLSVFADFVNPVSAPLVNLLIRKIGSTSSTSWEKHKTKLVYIFFSKCMYFPNIDSEFRKLVLDRVIDHYLIARRGYAVPYPEDSRPLYDQLVEEYPEADLSFNAWIPNSPYHADILSVSRRTAVLVLSKFDTLGQPVGPDLIQVMHVKSLGWTVIPVDRSKVTISDGGIGSLANAFTLSD